MPDLEIVLRWITHAGIIAYVIFAWTWDLPSQSYSKRFCHFIAAPFAWIGLWHQWTMFAPSPIRFNDVIVAEVYEGECKLFDWSPQSSTGQSFRESFLKSRENKFFEHLCNGRYPWMIEVLAEQIQHQAQSSGANPTHIVIRRLRSPITLDSVGCPQQLEDSLLYLHRVPQMTE